MFPLPSSCRLDLRPVGIIDGDVTNIMRMLIDSRRFLECCQKDDSASVVYVEDVNRFKHPSPEKRKAYSSIANYELSVALWD